MSHVRGGSKKKKTIRRLRCEGREEEYQYAPKVPQIPLHSLTERKGKKKKEGGKKGMESLSHQRRKKGRKGGEGREIPRQQLDKMRSNS